MKQRKKFREQIVAAARKQHAEIAQLFLDVEQYNRVHPDQPAIDPDPDGLLRRLYDGLGRFLADEDARPLPPIMDGSTMRALHDEIHPKVQ
jgi:hypothetical protein